MRRLWRKLCKECLLIQRSQSGDKTGTASVQTISSDAETVEYENLSVVVWNVKDQDKIRPPMSSAATAARWKMRMKTVEVPQMQFIDKVMDVRPPILVITQRKVSAVQVVPRTPVEILQMQFVLGTMNPGSWRTRTQKRKVVEAIETVMALIVTSALMTDELPHVTTSLIEKLTDAKVEEMILDRRSWGDVPDEFASRRSEEAQGARRVEVIVSWPRGGNRANRWWYCEEGDDQRRFHLPEPRQQFEVTTRRLWLGGDKYRVTRTDEIPNAYLVLTHCWAECSRISSADSEGNWGGDPAYSASTSCRTKCWTSPSPYRRPRSSVAKCRGITLKSACSNTLKSVCSWETQETGKDCRVWQKRQSAFDRRTYDLISVVDSSDQERIEEPTIRRLWKYIKRSPISDRVQ